MGFKTTDTVPASILTVVALKRYVTAIESGKVVARREGYHFAFESKSV